MMGRSFTCTAIVGLMMVMCSQFQQADAAAVMGIDFGSRFVKIALVKPGRPFEIVLNTQSKRKTDAVLAVDNGKRMYGSDAAGMATRRPQQSLFRLRDLLGRTTTHPGVTSLSEHLFEMTVHQHPESGSIGVTVGEQEYRDVLLVEELVAMLLQNARDLAAAHGETQVKDCVITVPSFFTQAEREALLDAAAIAEVNVLALIDENTAAALQFAIDNVYPDKPHRMVMYNMGAKAAQVSVFEFSGKHVKRGASNITQGEFRTMGKSWDEELGGDNFDQLLFKKFADEYNNKFGTPESKDIRAHPRAVARLKKLATKTKEVLSANIRTPASAEGLHDGNDFRSSATREFLEEAATPFVPRLTSIIDLALSSANLTVSDVDSVELIGGGTRVPIVKDTLKNYFGEAMELGSHLNGDEAMALGAVFHGANLSTAFRVRHIGMTEVMPFAVGVKLSDLADAEVSTEVDAAVEEEDKKQWKKSATLFKRFSNTVARKVVTFKRDVDITCALNYEVADDSPLPLPKGTDPRLGVFDIKGITTANTTYGHLGKPKVSLTFVLDVNSLARIVKAEAQFIDKVEVKVPVKKIKSNETITIDSDSSANATDTAAASNSTKTDVGTDADSKSADASTDADKKKAGDKATTDEENKKAKKNETEPVAPEVVEYTTEIRDKVVRVPLDIVRSDRGMTLRRISNDDIIAARKLLKDWYATDEERMLRATEMNNLEAYIFTARDKIRSNEDLVLKVTAQEKVDALMEELETMEDWLYEDEGLAAETKVYTDKRSGLKKSVDGIFLRAAEMKERPVVVGETRALLKALVVQVATWEKERPWVTKEERDALLARAQEVNAWLDVVLAKQEALTPLEVPAFLCVDVRAHLEPVQRSVEFLIKKRKPKPKVPKAPKKTVKKAKKEEKTKEGEEKTEEKKSEEGKKKEESEPKVETDAKEEKKSEDKGKDEL